MAENHKSSWRRGQWWPRWGRRRIDEIVGRAAGGGRRAVRGQMSLNAEKIVELTVQLEEGHLTEDEFRQRMTDLISADPGDTCSTGGREEKQEEVKLFAQD